MPAYSVTEYKNLPSPDTIWVWEGIIPTSGSCLLFGNPKLGKSFLSLGLCEAIADPTVDGYLGLPIQQHGPTLYIQLDTPRNLWKTGYLSTLKSSRAEDNIFIIDKELPDRPNPFDIRTRDAQLWIRGEVDRIKPVLTVVDTMRRMHRGDENDPTEASLVYDTIINCTQPSATLLLTHKKKQQHGDESLGTARGSTAFTGAVDAIVNMTKTALHIEARSDVDEEINIFQQDNGTWSINSRDEEIAEFISRLPQTGPKTELNQQIMDEFKVSLATAKRWRKNYTVQSTPQR